MKLIPTKVHGVIDYLTGTFLITSPWLFGLHPTGPEGITLILFGLTAIIYSIFTNYEFGFVRVLPVKTHLFLDVLSGIVLGASPWLFNFSDTSYKLHVTLGIFEIAAGLLTQPKAWPKEIV